jgi:HKD family nuclease
MTLIVRSVPGPEYENGHAALLGMTAADSKASIRAAVAFVTSSGVDLIERLLADRPGLALDVVARGAPITDPKSLVRLSGLGVNVSLVVGPEAGRFHPKLWLISVGGRFHVFSGSGNLTAGGLLENTEQFECLSFESVDDARVEEQVRRFERLIRGAVPLAELRRTPFWSAWEGQEKARRELAARQSELDEELAKNADSELAKAELYEDLVDLYERTKVQVRIPDKSGGTRPYVAARFKQSIDAGQKDGSIVTRVHGIVRKPTEGFNHLAKAGRSDLMVETLVLDESKRYHRLFSESTKERARSNLDAYRPERG